MPSHFIKIDKDYISEYIDIGFSLPAYLEKAIFKRQNQFVAGRLCATYAIKKLLKTESEYFISQDKRNRPIWPSNIVGSISHTDNFAVASVKSSHAFKSVGIDIEHIIHSKQTVESILELTFTTHERTLLSEFSGDHKVNVIYLIFSIKESLFKCLNPLCDILFDFKDVEVTSIDYLNNQLSVKLLKTLCSNNLYSGKILIGNFQFLEEFNLVYTEVFYQD